ncbi:WhiB family transcriptional regulator [Georgenia sp. 10Sc9-8]|uniref:Transcriptional regulator WhiB n=1 Tax=Georgenia halotolerans TaxID=3028317 RepID=A0ABT5TZJ2_9MICO|nr:WhiB family transcriptional regulator [Georgenia halotolerans]
MQLSSLLHQNDLAPTSWAREARGPAGQATTSPAGGAATAPRPTPCQEHPEAADLWFAERTADVERAKALCGPCPVRRECLAGALERGEPWGVWGGEILVDGAVVARKRGRGRPRKDEAAA